MEHFIDSEKRMDKVFKESLDLFKGRSLSFLDQELSDKVEDILSTEITQTTTKKSYADYALKLSGNKGLHSEWQAEVRMNDIMRFCTYNIDLARKHNIPFTTIIVTIKKPSVSVYESPSLRFSPIVVNLRERGAEEAIKRINDKLKKGQTINELELVYLPLYTSKTGKTMAELTGLALELTTKVSQDTTEQDKLKALCAPRARYPSSIAA